MTSTLPSSSSVILPDQQNQEGAVCSSSSNNSSSVGDPHNESDDDVQFVGVIPARPMRSSVWTQAPETPHTVAASIGSEGRNEALPDATAPFDATNTSLNVPAAAVSDVPQSAIGEETKAGSDASARAEGEDVSVTVAAIDRREFDTWDELTAYLDVYSARTHQVRNPSLQ